MVRTTKKMFWTVVDYFGFQMFTISHALFSSSPLPSTMMCFHRWPFIERGLFGNPLGVIWSVNMEGISLSMRLVCPGVSLTILVSCSLKAHVPPLSPHQQWSYWYVLSAGATGIAYPLEIVLGSYVKINQCFHRFDRGLQL